MVFVGETDNLGEPEGEITYTDWEGNEKTINVDRDGEEFANVFFLFIAFFALSKRSLPNPKHPEYEVIGIEHKQLSPLRIKDTKFMNFL